MKSIIRLLSLSLVTLILMIILLPINLEKSISTEVVYYLEDINSIDNRLIKEVKELDNKYYPRLTYYKLIEDNGNELKLDEELQYYTYKMCDYYGIEQHYKLILAQMAHESRYESNVVSNTDDYGLMQINKSNHKWLSEELGINDFLDPEDNIKAGVYMMSLNLNKYDESTALSLYNTGKDLPSTDYSKEILNKYSTNLVVIN